MRSAWLLALVVPSFVFACTSAGDAPASPREDAGGVDLNEITREAGGPTLPSSDAGPPDPDAVIRYATKVVSFAPGACSGFGRDQMPQIVLGPPKGSGDDDGSVDVVSLGKGGEIVLSFDPSIIVDRPGVDFVVFENAFYAGLDHSRPFVELGEVSVSEDGENWTTFPCTATEPPYGTCAGWHPVYMSEAWDPAKLDPNVSGGDTFDLETIGVARARFVRIKDKTNQRCTSQGPFNSGFDLDAIGVVHGLDP